MGPVCCDVPGEVVGMDPQDATIPICGQFTRLDAAVNRLGRCIENISRLLNGEKVVGEVSRWLHGRLFLNKRGCPRCRRALETRVLLGVQEGG